MGPDTGYGLGFCFYFLSGGWWVWLQVGGFGRWFGHHSRVQGRRPMSHPDAFNSLFLCVVCYQWGGGQQWPYGNAGRMGQALAGQEGPKCSHFIAGQAGHLEQALWVG